jgi:microcystin-dependent protein
LANPVRVRTSAGWQDLALVGEQGPQGVQGIQGVQGPTGAQGPQGEIGPIGTVYDSDQVGTIKAYAGTVIPTNWMLALGQGMTKTLYPQLHTALGIPAGTENFNLPDLSNKFLYGNTAPGVAPGGGAATVALAVTEMPAHRHLVDSHAHNEYNESGVLKTSYVDADHDHDVTSTGGTDGQGTHSHPAAAGSTFVVGGTTTGGAGTTKVVGAGANATTGDAGYHSHGVTVSGRTGGIRTNHRHNLVAQSPNTNWKGGATGQQSDASGATHNNMPPYILVAFIIKVKGVQLDAGDALVGPPGIQGPQGIQGEPGATGSQGIQGPAGVGTFRVGHTFSVAGALAAGALPGFFVPIIAGQTVTVVGARAKLISGTSISVQVTRNGSNLGSAATVTPTASAPTLSQALANNDELSITLASPTGSPVGLSFTIYLEHVA